MKFHLILLTILIVSQLLVIFLSGKIYGFTNIGHDRGYNYVYTDYLREFVCYMVLTTISFIGSFSMTFSILCGLLLTFVGVITQSVGYFFLTHYIILLTPILKGLWPVLVGE